MSNILLKALTLAGTCLLLAGSAVAGDKFDPPANAFAPPPPALKLKPKQHDWTGFYAGVQTGASFGNANTKWNGSDPSPTFGAHAGYNYQVGRGLVLGGESDLSDR